MNTTRKPLHHDITLPEQEAYAGYDYWRPSDASVQAAVCALIDAHADEFQELLDAAEFDAREQAAIDATEYMMEDR